MTKLFFYLGVVFLLLAVVSFLSSAFKWNVFDNLGRLFSNLPGNIKWTRGNMTVYLPIATMLIVSIVLSLALNLILKWFK
ncbi:hypothetical protein COTS27_01573 [Spirochaetota bacterium]|nr:hypothetical protein COTS27_01573 [Spirochaetota bacterium]